jgi:hypothetical protein
MVVVGGIYSPNHQNSRWGGLLSMGAPDSPVRQPRHPTVRVMTVSIVGALTVWATGQSGVAPDSHCSLSCAPSGTALTLCELSAHCSRCRRPLESTVALGSHCSASTPDSPVTHRTVQWIIAERGLRNPKVKSLKSIHPCGAPDTVVRQTRVHFGLFCSFLLNRNLDLFIGLCWTFGTCRTCNLEQTS